METVLGATVLFLGPGIWFMTRSRSSQPKPKQNRPRLSNRAVLPSSTSAPKKSKNSQSRQTTSTNVVVFQGDSNPSGFARSSTTGNPPFLSIDSFKQGLRQRMQEWKTLKSDIAKRQRRGNLTNKTIQSYMDNLRYQWEQSGTSSWNMLAEFSKCINPKIQIKHLTNMKAKIERQLDPNQTSNIGSVLKVLDQGIKFMHIIYKSLTTTSPNNIQSCYESLRK